jgi:ribosomal protein L35AE/L33A
MHESINLSFTLSTTDYFTPLGIRISLDGTVFHENTHVMDETHIKYPLIDDDGEHELTFEMFGKRSEHTQIDNDSNIVSDAVLTISDMEIDGIDINYLFQQLAVYHHDFNGTQAAIEGKCYGTMGCNGTVRFRFTTPVYIWLLENM